MRVADRAAGGGQWCTAADERSSSGDEALIHLRVRSRGMPVLPVAAAASRLVAVPYRVRSRARPARLCPSGGPDMPFIIAEPCIGVKDKSCVEVCPVNCIYEGEDQYYIHPDECIDCQACEAACPVQAIFPDNTVPEKWQTFIEKNRKHFENK
jgi:NAD-dependent dihydropyrimidine dehydrogenase PreA subunit